MLLERLGSEERSQGCHPSLQALDLGLLGLHEVAQFLNGRDEVVGQPVGGSRLIGTLSGAFGAGVPPARGRVVRRLHSADRLALAPGDLPKGVLLRPSN